MYNVHAYTFPSLGLGLELSIHKASGALRLKVAARAQVQELVTEVHLTHRKWHCLNIT